MSSISEIDKRFFLMVTPRNRIGHIGETDISKSCDICNEGRSIGRKFRMHLYIKSTYDNASIQCFNCGYTANMFSYLRDYHQNEFELYKKEKMSKSFNELRHKVKVNEPIIDVSFMKSEPKLEENFWGIPKLIDRIQFPSIPSSALEYLNKRGISPQPNWGYSPFNNIFKFNDKEVKLSDYIIIPFEYNNKWYGFQALAWKEKKFFVYLLNENDGFKVWNLDKINPDEPVYIFESIYDALSSGLDNVIAQIGITLSNEVLSKLKKPIFCLDNINIDEASLKSCKELAEHGYDIFIWPKRIPIKFKDTNDLLKANIPKEKIANLIKSNIFSGMEAVIKLKLI